MLFNSIEFFVFLPLVFFIYWFITRNKFRAQNLVLLIASYVFYGWWDWRFLFLLFGVGFTNYLMGLAIQNSISQTRKHGWLMLGLFINIGTLCIFKYYNFFIEGFIDLVALAGYRLPYLSTQIVLPIGISFYTFLSISYLIDIYKEHLKACPNLIDVLLSLSFFPIVLAGPIQRPALLLPQIRAPRVFEYDKAADGLRQILWGLFKKIVLADTCAANADYIFSNYETLNGSVLVMGAVYFSFQIYGDFSGYSDIAIGIGRLFGFDLMRNFAFPYFSTNIAMFWQRWHISLTTWFRDYVFLPISFALSKIISLKTGKILKTDIIIYMIASFITWLLTGLWHGANMTFVFWGMIHGIFLIFYHWQKVPRKNLLKRANLKHDSMIITVPETGITLALVVIAWIFFKADSLQHALSYLKHIVTNGIFTLSIIDLRGRGITSTLIDGTIAISCVVIIEWLQRNKQHGFEISTYPAYVRWILYWVITFSCLIFTGNERTFIYFQF